MHIASDNLLKAEELANTQAIEILIAQNARPHLNWLRFAKTHRARAKIRHWLALHEPDLIFDRNIVARKKAPALPPPKPSDKAAEPETRILDHSKVGIRERNVEVQWETVSPKATRRFQVTARTGGNLFTEVEGALKKFKGYIIEGKFEDGGLDILEGFFTVELEDAGDFGKVMKSLRTVPSAVKIRATG